MVTAYANGAAVETNEYLPFGQTRDQTGTAISNYKYTDQELDLSTGLYNYDARLYDPVIGRFITADNIIPNWLDPQLLNRYSYVRNNPLKFIDPTGHFPGHHSHSGLLMSNQNDPPPRVYEYEGNYKDMETGEIIDAKGLESPLVSPGDLIAIGGVIKVVVKGGGKLVGKGIVKGADDILVKASKNVDGLKYSPRVRTIGVEDPKSHNFPYSFDKEILSTKPIPKKNGYNIYQKEGTMRGKVVTDPKTGVRTQQYKEGVFEIGVTKDGVIDHRFFRPKD